MHLTISKIFGILLFGAIVFFQMVTLPVEYNASRRAIDKMEELGLVAVEDIPGSKKVLRAAALTYVAALAMAVMNLLRIFKFFLKRFLFLLFLI